MLTLTQQIHVLVLTRKRLLEETSCLCYSICNSGRKVIGTFEPATELITDLTDYKPKSTNVGGVYWWPLRDRTIRLGVLDAMIHSRKQIQDEKANT